MGDLYRRRWEQEPRDSGWRYDQHRGNDGQGRPKGAPTRPRADDYFDDGDDGVERRNSKGHSVRVSSGSWLPEDNERHQTRTDSLQSATRRGSIGTSNEQRQSIEYSHRLADQPATQSRLPATVDTSGGRKASSPDQSPSLRPAGIVESERGRNLRAGEFNESNTTLGPTSTVQQQNAGSLARVSYEANSRTHNADDTLPLPIGMCY